MVRRRGMQYGHPTHTQGNTMQRWGINCWCLRFRFFFNSRAVQSLCVCVCRQVGYFAYDTVCMLYYRRVLGNWGSYVHHIVIGLAMGVGIWTGVARTYHFIYLLEELSTPFLNMKNVRCAN